MQRYEYKVVVIELGLPGNNKVVARMIEGQLNNQGGLGWHVVAVTKVGNGLCVVFEGFQEAGADGR